MKILKKLLITTLEIAMTLIVISILDKNLFIEDEL